ncbi:Nn.00g100730.m01.CDS01 [Neocucurbitaria sp. VM-36]
MAEQDRIKLPGFGLPYNDWGSDKDHVAQSLSAVMHWDHAVLTVRERCMLFFINKITDKPDWQQKVCDEGIIAKWKQEASDLDWATVVTKDGDMSTKMFDYCIEELRAKAALYQKTGVIPVLDTTSCVLKSDTAISAELKDRLKKAVAPLEDVPNHQKDWHPGSDGKVLDLVHPSLFPLIYQRSRILPDSTITQSNCIEAIGKGEVIPDPFSHSGGSQPLASELWSSRFQWLPCNVTFPDGENAKINSYINNLHPADHKDLYNVIEKIITKAIPFWNIVCQSYSNGPLESTQRIKCSQVSYELPEGTEEYPPDDFDGDEDEFYDRVQALRVYDKPEPEHFRSLVVTAEAVDNKFQFLSVGEKEIQVIVKLANIHLSPDKPDYAGGSWHIEGQLNEHIIATALYYYDNDNITDSHLSFRTKVDADLFSESIGYEQNDFEGIEKIFGVSNDDSNIQDIGSVLTREDRFIAFPNGFQHSVGSFKLADPNKPGHRKIFALFLVAPTIPIISTANVPPQQRDWWLREVKAGRSQVSALPAELIDMIGDGVDDFPIGLAEAKALREELMVERGKMDQDVMVHMAADSFSFCEH